MLLFHWLFYKNPPLCRFLVSVLYSVKFVDYLICKLWRNKMVSKYIFQLYHSIQGSHTTFQMAWNRNFTSRIAIACNLFWEPVQSSMYDLWGTVGLLDLKGAINIFVCFFCRSGRHPSSVIAVEHVHSARLSETLTLSELHSRSWSINLYILQPDKTFNMIIRCNLSDKRRTLGKK